MDAWVFELTEALSEISSDNMMSTAAFSPLPGPSHHPEEFSEQEQRLPSVLLCFLHPPVLSASSCFLLHYGLAESSGSPSEDDRTDTVLTSFAVCACFFSSEPVDMFFSKHFVLGTFKHREEIERT